MTLFRPAPSRSRARNLLWTAAQCVVVWGLTLVVLPLLLVELERSVGIPGFRFTGQRRLAATLFIGASVLNLTTGAFLATIGRGTPLPLASPQQLVLSGPYRFLRNPMALAGILQGAAVAIGLGSWTVLLYSAAGGVFWHVALRPAEERDLIARFGESYEAYRRGVPLWCPRPRSRFP
jgi:protein-S-isoprenylcysteine O-methyltransferase Ste14